MATIKTTLRSIRTKEAVEWAKMILNDLRRLDLDFGQDVKRPHYEL